MRKKYEVRIARVTVAYYPVYECSDCGIAQEGFFCPRCRDPKKAGS